MVLHGIHFPQDALAEFCRRNGIRRLSLFGSILRDDFGPDSDVDMLVEFEPNKRIGWIGIAGLSLELAGIIGRRVDLRTPHDLSDCFRGSVVAEARTLHAA
jgi:uncharacterized protein